MQKVFKIIALVTIIIGLSVFAAPKKAHSQVGSSGIATYLPISSSKVEDGDIIIATDKGYSKSTTPYDSRIVGVVSTSPAISIKTNGQNKEYPVSGSGTAFTKVTGENGSIKKGDFITTSTTPGAGMKATDSGYVIGVSLDNVTFAKKSEVKLLEVTLNPHVVQFGSQLSSSLLDIFKLSKVAAYEKPSKVLQYIVAATIVIATFGCGFLIFAKAVNTGLEALGRNPLAGRMIQLSIVFNLLLILAVIAAGTALAYLVIRL